MKKLYTDDKTKFLVYHKQVAHKNKAPYVIFLHGLMSDMNGKKAKGVEEYCAMRGHDFIKFDNFGNGASSGELINQTISDRVMGINIVLNQLAADKPALLIGSSMGGWISLIAAKLRPEKVIGVITLAAAVDFTEELIWNNLAEKEKKTMMEKGSCLVRSSDMEGPEIYPVSYRLIEDGRKYLMLDQNSEKKVDISCPVHLIHGMLDTIVPYDTSSRVARQLKSTKVTVKLIKDADHRLSRAEDLRLLYNSIEEQLSASQERDH